MNRNAAVMFKWGERTFIYNNETKTVYLVNANPIDGLVSAEIRESLYNQGREEYRKTAGGGVDLDRIYDGLDELDDELKRIFQQAGDIKSDIESALEDLELNVEREVDSIQSRITSFMKEVKGKEA